MIYELRTYTTTVGSLPKVVKLFEDHLEQRTQYSALGGFWCTEIGPLNQIVHLWPYESLEQRRDVRASFSTDPHWPPPIMELLEDMSSDIIVPFSSVAPVSPGAHGPIYELRSYRLEPGTGPTVNKIWDTKLGARSELSKPLLIGTTEFGALNKLIHIWPYASLADRGRIRTQAVEAGLWPPPTAPHIQNMQNLIMLPTAFSPVQ